MNDEYAKQVAAWLRRSGETARALAGQYADLAALVAAGSGAGDDSGVHVKAVDAPLPVRVDVIDLRADIAGAAEKYAGLVRGTLRMGSGGTADVGGRLRFIGGALTHLWEADPDLTQETVAAVWGLHRSAWSVINPTRRVRPFRSDREGDVCPECGSALFVWPKEWLLACGPCGLSWGIGAPVVAL